MMIRRSVLLVFLLTVTGSVIHDAAQNRKLPEIQSGVSKSLAEWRAAHYRAVRYGLQIELKPNAEFLTGTNLVRVMIDNPNDDLILDWRAASSDEARKAISSIEANGRKVENAQFLNDHLLIPHEFLKAGENVLQIEFQSPVRAAGSAVTRYRDREDNSEYIYTLFVPSDASTVFPCFDQPDLKARFTLDVAAPEKWKVISNTPSGTEAPNPRTIDVEFPLNLKLTDFLETEPISTYQFAFAAGEFAGFKDESSPFGTNVYVRKSKAERARRELAEIFRINRDGVRFFENYFAHKFPFPKYDLVLIPEFAYGGMEHAGATFLREDAILFPSDPTTNDFISRAEVMLHEAAHQWFGDLVTMRWFDDLWLKEGFATFMAYKAMEVVAPQAGKSVNVWKAFYQRTKPAAYLTDVTKGTTPIFQEIPNLSAAKSAYGNIVYRKAPSFLRQAEFFFGADDFQKAIQTFVREHAYSNATWSDLVNSFARVSHRNLETWANEWVKQRGMPDVRVEWSAKNDRIESLKLKESDVLHEGGVWQMRAKVLLAYADGKNESFTVTLNGKETDVREAFGMRKPAFIFANCEDYGYGRFLLDNTSRDYVLKNLGNIKDDFLRALLWGSLWDSVREAELAPDEYVNLALALVANEQDEVAAQTILARTATAFNRYLSDAQQREFAPRLEKFLSAQMYSAPSAGLRITYFRAFQSVATTDEARAELKKLLRDEKRIEGVTLRTRDRFDIITALLSRGDADALALLAEQKTRDTSDDAKRYGYAAAAAEPNAETKRKYFDAYMNDKQLPESWIEASLGPFNALSQSQLTKPYLADALRALPQMKRTRKIFFVNNWLAAFIGGQRDAEALKIVRDFLNENQSLDRDLRLKVLEAVDGLERTVRIRAKYNVTQSRA
jgi:aminopeptidase N